jgi:hypothetical protein
MSVAAEDPEGPIRVAALRQELQILAGSITATCGSMFVERRHR